MSSPEKIALERQLRYLEKDLSNCDYQLQKDIINKQINGIKNKLHLLEVTNAT